MFSKRTVKASTHLRGWQINRLFLNDISLKVPYLFGDKSKANQGVHSGECIACGGKRFVEWVAQASLCSAVCHLTIVS